MTAVYEAYLAKKKKPTSLLYSSTAAAPTFSGTYKAAPVSLPAQKPAPKSKARSLYESYLATKKPAVAPKPSLLQTSSTAPVDFNAYKPTTQTKLPANQSTAQAPKYVAPPEIIKKALSPIQPAPQSKKQDIKSKTGAMLWGLLSAPLKGLEKADTAVGRINKVINPALPKDAPKGIFAQIDDALGQLNRSINPALPKNAPRTLSEQGGQATEKLTGSKKLAALMALGISFAEPFPGGGKAAAAKKFAGEIESSVVQVVNMKTGAQGFWRIPKGQLKAFHNLIDDTEKGIAGIPDAAGYRFHLTAKTPEQMMDAARGFKDYGVADLKMIPTLVEQHARSNAPRVREYIRRFKDAYDASPFADQRGMIKNPFAKAAPTFREAAAPLPKSGLEAGSSFNPSTYVKEQVAKREAARGTEGVLDKTKSFLANIKSKLVDMASPIEDTLAAAVRKSKIKLLPSEQIKNQIDRVLRAPTLAGQFAKDKGIADVIRKVSDLDEFDQYLIAKHAIDVDTRGIKTGRDLAKDQALVKAFAPKYEQYATQVKAYSNALLDKSVDSGLISKELAEALRARYPNYVPFQRVFEEVESHGGSGGIASLGKQTIVQKIVGSGREIESPIESLLSKTNDVFMQGEKNVAAKILAGYEKLPGNPFKLKEIKGFVDEKTGRKMFTEGDKARDTISFFDNGEKRMFATTPEIAQAAKSLNVQQMNILGKIFALPTRVARIGITGINIPFIAANIARDQVSAFINSNHALRSSVANPLVFTKALTTAVGHGKLYDDWIRAAGGGTSFDLAREQVEHTVGSIRAGKNIATKIAYTVRHPSELLRAVENIVARSEEFTRLQQFQGTYKGALKKGLSEAEATIEAAAASRENTINFARRGEWGTVLNSTLLYLNASIQGTRTLLRNLKTKPVSTSVKIALTGLMPVATATYWNLSDPERKAAYQDIAEYEKENNLILIPPNPTKDEQGKWNVIKIPLSQEINSLVGMARKPIEQMYGLDPIAFKDIAQALIGSISPIEPTKGSITSSLVPQAIKPSVEAITNQSLFTGFPQVSERLSKLSPERQVKPYTSGTARQIGNKLGVSPIKVEEFIKGTFGGVGSQALNAVDRVLAKVGLIPKDQIGGQDILDAITARFNKARGGDEDEKVVDELEELLIKQADESDRLKQEALSLDKELLEMPKETANEHLKELKKTNPLLAEKLKDVIEERKLGLTYSEKLMKQLHVENGERARYIHEKLMELPEEDRAAYYAELRKKKIISDEVAKQVKKLKKGQDI